MKRCGRSCVSGSKSPASRQMAMPFIALSANNLGAGFSPGALRKLTRRSEAQRQRQSARLLVMAEGMVVLKSIGLDSDARAAFDLG